MGKNDIAWSKLFEKYKILNEIEQNNEFIITANQIKEFREPRLMAKFDHKINLPDIFLNNNLSILPLSRNNYIISTFDAYKNFETTAVETIRINIPKYNQSLAPNYIISETVALNFASACGILNDFLEDENLVPTVSGRMSSGNFDFKIATDKGNKLLSVNKSTIEIDAAFEGVNYLSLFEAKQDISDDFLVRQLYYPFRVWSNRVTKQVKSVFLIFSNGVFYLYEYSFDDPTNYNSLRLIKRKNYSISSEISITDIQELLRDPYVVNEPEIAFPQANSMSRVINLCELLFKQTMTRHDITSEYSFDIRQTSYYTDAGRYLSLIEKSKDTNGDIVYQLSNEGKRIMNLTYREKQIAIAKQILKHKPFKETLRLHLENGVMPEQNRIVEIMKQSNLYNVKSQSTFERRASTVEGWINWILNLVDE